MNILILGSGGREHALAWKVRQSRQVEKVFVSPGNAGIGLEEKITQVKLNTDNHIEVINFARANKIDLTIVGPENLLASGIVDSFQKEGLLIFGPTKEAAQLESSKSFAKDIMKEFSIPTARYAVFENANEAKVFVKNNPWNSKFVIKCDGLAGGKGVVVTDDNEEAIEAINQLLTMDRLGINNKKIVLEERLYGKEVSAFAICCGENFLYLGNACDYKNLKDGNLGPNTGGMGTYSPVTWLSQKQQNDIQEKIISPLLKGLIQKKIHYTGVLFVGLMITNDGPKVIEFNCRFGDPETQVLLPLLDEDLAELIFLAASNQLENKILKIKNHPGAAVHVVMASYGYPGTGGIKIRTGDIIKWDSGFYKNLEIEKKGKLFFAGVKEIDSQIVTAGGRVLGLTCLGKDRQEARENVYQNYKKIHFDGAQLRRDIGL